MSEKQTHETAHIDKSATIESDVIIDRDVVIGERTLIERGAAIGDHTRIRNDVMVEYNTRISSRVAIGNGVWIGNGVSVGMGVKIGGYARIRAGAVIGSGAVIPAYAKVAGNVITFNTVGSEGGTLTAYVDTNEGLCFTRGCFAGNLVCFLDEVSATHGDNKYAQSYRLLVETATILLLR